MLELVIIQVPAVLSTSPPSGARAWNILTADLGLGLAFLRLQY